MLLLSGTRIDSAPDEGTAAKLLGLSSELGTDGIDAELDDDLSSSEILIPAEVVVSVP